MKSNHEVYMKSDLSGYLGKWIAICEGRIVASGSNAKEVYRKTSLIYPDKRIMLVKVPDKEAMIF